MRQVLVHSDERKQKEQGMKEYDKEIERRKKELQEFHGER